MPPIYSQQQPPTYDPFVKRNPLEFAAAQGNLAVTEVTSPDLGGGPPGSRAPVVEHTTKPKFFPGEAQSQDRGFMPEVFTTFGTLQQGARGAPGVPRGAPGGAGQDPGARGHSQGQQGLRSQ